MDFCWLSYLALADSLFTGLLGLCLILGLCTKVNDMAYILLFGQSWLTQGMLGGFLFLLAVVRFKVANEYWHVKERIKIS